MIAGWCARSPRLLVVAAALVAVTILTAPEPALAHAGLESSTPAASSVLEVSPPLISLDFDEDIDVPLTSIELFDQGGTSIGLGPPLPGADGSIVDAAVPPLVDGTYAVVWRVSSADGHVVAGAFSFQVGASTDSVDTDALIDSLLGEARADPAVGRSLGISRFEAFIGASLLIGGLFMILCVDRAATIGFGARQLLWIGWALLMLGTIANFGLLGANARAGSVGDMLDTSVWGDIADTRTGGLLLVRAALGVLFVGLLLTVSRRVERWWRAAAVVLGVVTVLTFSGVGHPSVESTAAIWVGFDVLHFGGVVLWMGSLAMIAVGGRAWLRDDHHVVAVRSFSTMATIVVPIIVVSGVAQAWRLGGGLAELTETTWGRILLVKSCVVVLLVAIGAASRWLLHNDGPAEIRRTVVAEVILGVAVLGLAAALVGVPPASISAGEVYSAALTQAGVVVDVDITPGKVGANEVHVVVTPPAGNLAQIAELEVRMSLPEREIPNTPVTMIQESTNHYTGNVTLPFAGAWTLEIVVSPEPNESVLLTDTVVIPDG